MTATGKRLKIPITPGLLAMSIKKFQSWDGGGIISTLMRRVSPVPNRGRLLLPGYVDDGHSLFIGPVRLSRAKREIPAPCFINRRNYFIRRSHLPDRTPGRIRRRCKRGEGSPDKGWLQTLRRKILRFQRRNVRSRDGFSKKRRSTIRHKRPDTCSLSLGAKKTGN